MSAESPLNRSDASGQVLPLSGGKNSLRGNLAARRAALDWVGRAAATVLKVYPQVDWSRATLDADAAFQEAMCSFFWESAISEDEFRQAWRAFYQSCL